MSLSKRPLYQEIASLFDAFLRCNETNNEEWITKHYDNIEHLCKNFMPAGSGIDCGTKFDFDSSKRNKSVFTFSYHHMNENGFYCGWTEHQAIVRPSLQFKFDLNITGRDRNQIKDYLYDCYNWSLRQLVWQTQSGAWHSNLYEVPMLLKGGLGI